jgi:hypothetical protein
VNSDLFRQVPTADVLGEVCAEDNYQLWHCPAGGRRAQIPKSFDSAGFSILLERKMA